MLSVVWFFIIYFCNFHLSCYLNSLDESYVSETAWFLYCSLKPGMSMISSCLMFVFWLSFSSFLSCFAPSKLWREWRWRLLWILELYHFRWQVPCDPSFLTRTILTTTKHGFSWVFSLAGWYVTAVTADAYEMQFIAYRTVGKHGLQHLTTGTSSLSMRKINIQDKRSWKVNSCSHIRYLFRALLMFFIC